MALEDELHEEMLALYRRAGEEAGYWGRRYLQAVRRKGGLATAKEMLRPRTKGQRAGLDKLLEARRPELTLEYLVLQPKYRALFTDEETSAAKERLSEFEDLLKRHVREHLYPDEFWPGRKYPEGSRRQVRVNAFERDARARTACLVHHGSECAVCGLSFQDRYGALGQGFIHVHHVRPLSSVHEGYRVDPIEDLIPVCPNCHAMLHRKDPPLTVDELRGQIRDNAQLTSR